MNNGTNQTVQVNAIACVSNELSMSELSTLDLQGRYDICVPLADEGMCVSHQRDGTCR